jgi:4-amino-4-deoxy-L-arabinose transferase-like glycosyltransferase
VSFLRDRRLVPLALLALVALAFGLRAAEHHDSPRPLGAAGLAAEQGEMARHIVDDGRWFVLNPKAYDLLKKRQAEEQSLVDLSRVDFSSVDRGVKPQPVVDQMPGVAVILSGLWWVTGDKSYAWIQWLQVLIDTAMVLVVYWIGSRLTGRTGVGLLAALLYAVWWKAIRYANIPRLDTWAVFFTIACVAAFVWAREQPSRRGRLVLLGALAGVGIYFRPFMMLVPIALALVATPDGGWRRRIGWVVAPTAIALLILSPWTIRNYFEFDRFIPTRTGLGQAVFEGSGQASSDEIAKSHVRGQGNNAAYGSPSYDDTLLESAVRAISDDPLGYFGHVFNRLRFLLPCLLVLVAWRRWGTAALIPAAAAAATVIPYAFIGDDRRFYLPMFFAYFILIAMATDVVLSLVWRSRSFLRRPVARTFGRSIDSGDVAAVAQSTNPDSRTRPQ